MGTGAVARAAKNVDPQHAKQKYFPKFDLFHSKMDLGLTFSASVYFSRMRSEGSRFTWGSGGEAVFAKFCVCVRKCPQPSATACGDAVRLSTVASVSGVDQKACQIERLSPQLYWRLQRRCLRE